MNINSYIALFLRYTAYFKNRLPIIPKIIPNDTDIIKFNITKPINVKISPIVKF